MSAFVTRSLIVDDQNPIFLGQGMQFKAFPSDRSRVRAYTKDLLSDCPEMFLDGTLLETQIAELVMNAVKHGNRNDPSKEVRIWYDFRHRVRLVIEDEGDGFQDLDAWNEFFVRRQQSLHRLDFESFLSLARYEGPKSEASDGGIGLIMALEYWNGGMIYNGKKNKLGVTRWYTHPV